MSSSSFPLLLFFVLSKEFYWWKFDDQLLNMMNKMWSNINKIKNNKNFYLLMLRDQSPFIQCLLGILSKFILKKTKSFSLL